MKIVALDYQTLNPGDIDDIALRQLGDFSAYDRSDKEEGVTRANNAEVLIVNKFLVTREFIKQLPNLKYICVSATGYNNVDIQAAKESGIIVSNVSGYSVPAVVQHVFALIFTITNKVAMYAHEVSDNVWSEQPHFSYWHEPIYELKAKTMGLYGYGDIAQSVAQVALAYGMNVLVHHPNKKKYYSDNISWVSAPDLLMRSDILSLHAPLNDGTQNFINKDSLALMKASAILINTARGPLVQEQELYEVLSRQGIRAAGLDVLCQEPPRSDHPLFSLDNCTITPHQAWASSEARRRLLDGLVQNILGYKVSQILNRVV